MKSILLALALITSGAAVADDADHNPCDAVENDQQTLACSVFSRNTAEQLLAENFEGPASAHQRAVRLCDATQRHHRKIKPRRPWLHQRDADCAIVVFPAKAGTEAFNIAQNDCIAAVSDDRSEFLESIGQE
jgi:uncharacterized protein YecT (DUF1311 family)